MTDGFRTPLRVYGAVNRFLGSGQVGVSSYDQQSVLAELTPEEQLYINAGRSMAEQNERLLESLPYGATGYTGAASGSFDAAAGDGPTSGDGTLSALPTGAVIAAAAAALGFLLLRRK